MTKAKKAFVLTDNKGYSLIEITMVLGLITILVVASLSLYNYRVAPTTWAASHYDTYNGVVAQLNTCKSDRGGSFPVAPAAASITAATTTTTNSALSPYVGTASPDIAAWTYQCAAGATGATIIITDTAPSTDATLMLLQKINNNGSGATATNIVVSGVQIVIPGTCS